MIQPHMTHTLGDGKVKVSIECGTCQNRRDVVITMPQYQHYMLQTSLIQDYMGDKTPAERELFISGTCGDCYKEIWAVFEDDDSEGDDGEWAPNEDGMN